MHTKNIFIFGDSHIRMQHFPDAIPGVKIYSDGIHGATLYGINKHLHIFEKILQRKIDIIVLHLGMNDIDGCLPIFKRHLSYNELFQQCIDNMDVFMRNILRIQPTVLFYVCNAHNHIVSIALKRFRLHSEILKTKIFARTLSERDFNWFVKIYRSKYTGSNIDIKRQCRMLETNVYYNDPLFQKYMRPEDTCMIEKHLQNIPGRTTLFNRKIKAYCRTHTHATLVNIGWYLNRISRQKCVMTSPWMFTNSIGDNHFATEIFCVSLLKAFHHASSLLPQSYLNHTQKNQRRTYRQTLKKYRIDDRLACTF